MFRPCEIMYMIYVTKNGLTEKILVFLAYAQKPPLHVHADISRRVRGLDTLVLMISQRCKTFL